MKEPSLMLTISPVMLFVRNNVLALVASSFSAAALACSPVQGLDLAFPNNSAALDARSALRLGNWLADLKARFPNYSMFVIDGHTDAGERGALALAKSRAETVQRFLTDRGFQPQRVHVNQSTSSYNKPTAGIPTRSASVDFVPACPHACCSLTTHEVDDKGEPMPSEKL
ncbi:OmpA family protein [Ralstonia sp. SET104]|uniref:OmpA family protein n=1 Tax=Ralstonia sp. SET104 TaxID=2448774 RepID=UPI0016281675|nr:OmpA family protein [Ralstonia sp. SET104]